MLETFNPVARPDRVKYDPLSLVQPGELAAAVFPLGGTGTTRSRQPLRVVLNARFRLPAGEYELAHQGSDVGWNVFRTPSLGLQIGREGRPLETWPLPLTPGSSHSTASGCRSMRSSSDFARRVRWSGRLRSCGSER